MYALCLSEENRIIYACVVLPTTPANFPRVDTLPEGDINNWLFVDNEYVYDPLPVPVSEIRASAKFAPGEYFTIDGTVYRATTTVPAGDAVIPGTNCAVIDMADALNALK